MSLFREKDVRRCYDLLQHDADLGHTQLLAKDAGQIIGLGLFDNEEDFVNECVRYNTLGDLYVGVNPRSMRLLDQFGGLKNRMRSVFADVSDPSMIDHITGIAVPDRVQLTSKASEYRREVSRLHDRETFYALGKPLPIRLANRFGSWILKQGGSWTYNPDQYVRVPGTALIDGGYFSRRVIFRRYRPYQLIELSEALLESGESV